MCVYVFLDVVEGRTQNGMGRTTGTEGLAHWQNRREVISGMYLAAVRGSRIDEDKVWIT